MRTVLRIIGVVLALISTGFVTNAGSTPTDCIGGGGLACSSPPPYAEVTFFGQETHDWFETSPPYVLDRSQTDSEGSGRGVVDLGHGLLKAHATGAPAAPQFTVITTGVDVFTLLGPPGTYPVTALLAGHGFGFIPDPGGNVLQAMVQITGPGAQDFDRQVFQRGTNAPGNQSFPIDLDASIAFNATVGTPFTLSYFLRLDAALSGDLDFGATGALTFNLPPGIGIRSAGGFPAQAEVPEPATLMLLSASLAATAAAGWRRHRGK
jgi:hypothetical protein